MRWKSGAHSLKMTIAYIQGNFSLSVFGHGRKCRWHKTLFSSLSPSLFRCTLLIHIRIQRTYILGLKNRQLICKIWDFMMRNYNSLSTRLFLFSANLFPWQNWCYWNCIINLRVHKITWVYIFVYRLHLLLEPSIKILSKQNVLRKNGQHYQH